jgi:hypothetical protein
MKKSDLENGMVAITRTDHVYLILKPFDGYEFMLTNGAEFIPSIRYDDNLTYIGNSGMESMIEKVYNFSACGRNIYDEILKNRSEIDLSGHKVYMSRHTGDGEIILNKIDSIQKQLDEVKNMVS